MTREDYRRVTDKYNALKRSGESVQDYCDQRSLFDTDLTSEQRDVLASIGNRESRRPAPEQQHLEFWREA
jgi:hypothetical protein